MKPPVLRFLVREWANSFFLVDNLAFPIDSLSREYNREWLDRFGKLSDEEKNAIDRYKSLKKAVWDEGGRELLSRFEASFYQSSESNPIEGKDLQEILTKDRLKELDMVFEVFKDRFQSMWKEYEPILLTNLSLVEKEFPSIRTDLEHSLSAIGKLYRVSNPSKQAEVYLVMRPDAGFRGGLALSRKPVPKVRVGAGLLDPKSQEQKNHLWLLLLHELTHACFENDKFFKFLYAYLDKRPPLAHFLEKYPATKTPALATRRAMREMIINSIEYGSYIRGKFDQSYTGSLEDGETILKEVQNYLGETMRKGKSKHSLLLKCGLPSCYQYIAWKLEKVVRPYLEEGQEMDKQFLDSVYKVLEEFPDNLLEDLKSAK